AVLRLDGKVLSVPDGKVTGVAKGESLEDIGEMFNSYGDLVIMRHPETDAVERISKNLTLPLINAGNGSGQHPTQALLDWYALLKWRPEFSLRELKPEKKIHLGIIGTPGSMRAVNSFLRMSLLFHDAIDRITVVSEMRDPLGPRLRELTENSSVELKCTDDVSNILPELDVIYMNSIAFLGDSYRQMDSRFSLSHKSTLKKGAVVLHPLARRQELSESLDASQHNLYFAQASGAVFMRQALLITILDRIRALPKSVLYLVS
ncbi:MAG TPA: aspartate carbamoyltransferase, partial [Candidatus Krumholzibacteria bacterium]|nr:aspartate carbamoyltransferase [Candidatus Krumholzibacteria bacterium]